MNLNGKKILLTGCASGIGKELLQELLRFDCSILAVDLKPDNIIKNPKIHPYLCDLSVKEEVERLFESAFEIMGGIDIFIANAGFAYYEEYANANWDRLERIYRLNVLSPLYTVARMKELNGSNPYKVVLTASAMAMAGIPGYSVYSSTKAAVHSFADCYRFEPGVRKKICVVYPIATKTDFFLNAGNNIPRAFPAQNPQTVARKIINGITKDRRRVYPSIIFTVMLLINRIFPFSFYLYKKAEQKKFLNWLERSSKPDYQEKVKTV